jgi:rubredoxin
MQAYMCSVCGYVYDNESAEKNIEGNSIPFEELDPEWICPGCGVAERLFQPTESDRTPDVPANEK